MKCLKSEFWNLKSEIRIFTRDEWQFMCSFLPPTLSSSFASKTKPLLRSAVWSVGGEVEEGPAQQEPEAIIMSINHWCRWIWELEAKPTKPGIISSSKQYINMESVVEWLGWWRRGVTASVQVINQDEQHNWKLQDCCCQWFWRGEVQRLKLKCRMKIEQGR